MQIERKEEKVPLPFRAFMITASVLVMLGGVLLYHSQKIKLASQKHNELAAIASLKAIEISRWRLERIRDGKIFGSIFRHEDLVSNVKPEFREELLGRMAAFVENYDYISIVLTDTTGSVMLRYPTSGPEPSLSEPVSELRKSPEVSLSQFHFSDVLPESVHIDVHVPIFSSDGKFLGIFIMIVDPHQILFPLIQTWPTPSKTSETLIIKPDGDSLVYLNELRHRKNTALKLKLPLNDQDLPAAQAVKGYEGVYEGYDYRGIPVISYLLKIPSSPWFMVAKVDKSEMYSPLKEQMILIISMVFLLVSSLVIFTFSFIRRRHIGYLQELNATKDRFFSIVSHDLKTPFISINGFAGMLYEDARKKDPDKIHKYAGIILNSSKNALALLYNLTEWARLQTRRIDFNPRELDALSIVTEVVSLLSAAASHKSITIIHEVPEGFKIQADKEMLSAVLRNLISNSIKFSHPGGIINIRLTRKGNTSRIEVSDQGIGISTKIMNKLFSIGETISTPGTHSEYGTGLGLILVKEFVTMHGGDIHVDSEPGKGSTFTVTLPDKV